MSRRPKRWQKALLMRKVLSKLLRGRLKGRENLASDTHKSVMIWKMRLLTRGQLKKMERTLSFSKTWPLTLFGQTNISLMMLKQITMRKEVCFWTHPPHQMAKERKERMAMTMERTREMILTKMTTTNQDRQLLLKMKMELRRMSITGQTKAHI